MDKEYIEREAVLELIRNKWFYNSGQTFQALLDIPAADVEPVRHGKWEFISEKYANCTNCGTIFEALPTQYAFKRNNIYCRHCGARMDGGSPND